MTCSTRRRCASPISNPHLVLRHRTSSALRALQEREFERVGDSHTIKVDVRFIAATNSDLAKMVSDGTFREDLYYRLNVIPICLPPLRDRRDDIPLLVWAMIERLQARLGRQITRVPRSVMDRLVSYAWPGNVRELENVVERALILAPGPTLQVEETLNPAGPRHADHRLDEVRRRSNTCGDRQTCSDPQDGSSRQDFLERIGRGRDRPAHRGVRHRSLPDRRGA